MLLFSLIMTYVAKAQNLLLSLSLAGLCFSNAEATT